MMPTSIQRYKTSGIWKTTSLPNMDSLRWFNKQDAALNHCRSQEGEDNGVFVLHKLNVRRRLVNCSYSEFCKEYLALNAKLCNFFEFIREDIPARLYFDIVIHYTVVN